VIDHSYSAVYVNTCYILSLSVVYIFFFFFFNDTATTEIYTLSLHDALPILKLAEKNCRVKLISVTKVRRSHSVCAQGGINVALRSEEHTSELQSRFDLVCRLLLEKKKKKTQFT